MFAGASLEPCCVSILGGGSCVCLSSGVSLVLSDRPGRRVGMEAAFIVRQQLEALRDGCKITLY
jgi:hypothetical protein